MDACKMCGFSLGEEGDFIQCFGTCNDKFHFQCSGIKSSTYKNMSSTNKKQWKCLDCRRSKTFKELNLDSTAIGLPNIKQMLQALDEKINVIFELKNQFSDLKESIEFLSGKYDLLLDKINIYEQCSKDLTVKCDSLLMENVLLKKNISNLEIVQSNCMQDSLSNSIEINGLFMKDDEDLIDVVELLKIKLGLEHFDNNNIISLKRLFKTNVKNKAVKNYTPTLKIDFKNATYAKEWITKRKIKISNKDIFKDSLIEEMRRI